MTLYRWECGRLMVYFWPRDWWALRYAVGRRYLMVNVGPLSLWWAR